MVAYNLVFIQGVCVGGGGGSMFHFLTYSLVSQNEGFLSHYHKCLIPIYMLVSTNQWIKSRAVPVFTHFNMILVEYIHAHTQQN